MPRVGLEGLLVVALVAGFAFPAVSGPTSAAGPLNPEEQRGKQIYVAGTSASGRAIKALLGDESLEMEASMAPCASCHASDGRGNPEGGVTPSNISWESLTKTYGVTHASGRNSGPYTPALLKRAIQEGIDSAGNRLGAAMPKYSMAAEDFGDLIAYLKRLGSDLDPGLSETAIRVGTVLPLQGPLAGLGSDLNALLTAYFERVNRQGGIYSRRIDLRVVETAETPEATRIKVSSFVERERIFALVGSLAPGMDRDLPALVEQLRIPLVGPLAVSPQAKPVAERNTFYLLSGLGQQARALVAYAIQKVGKIPVIGIVYPRDDLLQDIAEQIEEQCKRSGCGAVSKSLYPRAPVSITPEMVRALRENGVSAVVFLGTGQELNAFLKAAEPAAWTPYVLALGSSVSADLFKASPRWKNRIFLAFPMAPSDLTPAGLGECFDDKRPPLISSRYLAYQVSACASAIVFVEALRRAGRDLSRGKLLAALESFNEFQTGLTPVITYGPNRRVGALGAQLVAVDVEKQEFGRNAEWISPQ